MTLNEKHSAELIRVLNRIATDLELLQNTITNEVLSANVRVAFDDPISIDELPDIYAKVSNPQSYLTGDIKPFIVEKQK